MANAIFRQGARSVDYVPAAALDAGAVVPVGDLLGVAKRPIGASAPGALALEGVYDLLKDGTAGPVFEAGDAVFWDRINGLAVRTGGSGCWHFGPCVRAAGTNEATVRARLRPYDLPFDLQDKLWEDVDLSAADLTLGIEDCGKVLNVTDGGDGTYSIILPEAAAGLRYVVRCGADGELIIITTDQTNDGPDTPDIVTGFDFPGTAGKGRVLAAATARKGDYVSLEYGGTNAWVIRAQRGIWTEEA